MDTPYTRRQFLGTMTVAGTASLLSYSPAFTILKGPISLKKRSM